MKRVEKSFKMENGMPVIGVAEFLWKWECFFPHMNIQRTKVILGNLKIGESVLLDVHGLKTEEKGKVVIRVS